MTWRDDPITDKQAKFIEVIQEYSYYNPPRFTGTTKGEAADYIGKYGKLACEDVGSTKFGE